MKSIQTQLSAGWEEKFKVSLMTITAFDQENSDNQQALVLKQTHWRCSKKQFMFLQRWVGIDVFFNVKFKKKKKVVGLKAYFLWLVSSSDFTP